MSNMFFNYDQLNEEDSYNRYRKESEFDDYDEKKPNFKKENRSWRGLKNKIIKKYSFSYKQYIIKKKYDDSACFVCENEGYELLKKHSLNYKDFIKNARSKEGRLGQTFARKRKKLFIKLTACKMSLQELLDSLQDLDLEKSLESIQTYFETLKNELAHHNDFLESDRKKMLKNIENHIILPSKQSIASFKRKLPFYFLDACGKVLEYLNILHSNELCHLDLKADNCVLDSFKDVFLIDLESIRPAINIIKEITTMLYTPQYADPEILSENKVIKDGRRCDSFSFSLIIKKIITLLDSLNYYNKDNEVILFLKKLEKLFRIKRIPIIKVMKLIKVFKLNHMNDFQSNDLEFDDKFFISLFIQKRENKTSNFEIIEQDYCNIIEQHNYLDHVPFFNENAYLSYISTYENNNICQKFSDHLLDIKSSLNEYPIFFFYVYGQKNITFPRFLQILGHHYYSLNRYSDACCFLRSSWKWGNCSN